VKRGWGAAIVAAGILLLGGLYLALQREETPVVGPSTELLEGTRTVQLFFPSPDGGIRSETREILGGEFLEQDVRRAVEELIAGGATGLHPLPPATRLVNVFSDGEGEITLNFSEHLRADHPGGSEAEMATLRCLVATIGTSFPGVDRVRILIEGETVPSLAGHADLRDPLEVADFR